MFLKKALYWLKRGHRAAAAAGRLMIAKMRSCIIEENIKMRYNQYATIIKEKQTLKIEKGAADAYTVHTYRRHAS